MTIVRFVATLVVLAVACTVVELAAPCLGAVQIQPDVFDQSADVIEVRVTLTVADRSGEPISGLRAADFEVLDDGRRQAISRFEALDDVRALAPPRRFLLLFDTSFTSSFALERARSAARELTLTGLDSHDLLAVATLNIDRGAELVSAFTPDRAQTARALDLVGAGRTAAGSDPLRLIAERTDTSDPALPQVPSSAVDAANDRDQTAGVPRQLARADLRNQVVAWTRAFSELARALDSVPGRKEVLYFSGGFDATPLLGGQDRSDPLQPADQVDLELGNVWRVETDELYGQSLLQRQVSDLLEQVRRADCVVHAIDASGLRSGSDPNERRRRAGRESLFVIANATAGALVTDTNNLDAALEPILERSRANYVVIFEPDRIEVDGSYHRLDVRVDLPRGSTVLHRPGYYAPRSFAELHPLERDLLAAEALVGATPKQEIGLAVLAPPFRIRTDRAYLAIIVEARGADLLEQHSDSTLTVEIYAYLTDSSGAMREHVSDRVTVDLAKGRPLFERTGLKYYGHVEIGTGMYQLRVLVRNASTGRTGVSTQSVAIPDYGADSVLLPALFPEPANSWLLVREVSDGTAAASVVYPFVVGGDPFVPAAAPTFRNASTQFYLVAYGLAPGDVELTGGLRATDDEAAVGVAVRLIDRSAPRAADLTWLHAEIEAPDLPPGDYVLELRVEDVKARELSTSLTVHIP